MTRREGFTLVEVTVLIAVVGLLASLFAGSAQGLLEQSRSIRARDDVEKIGRAVAEFYADTGFFPRTQDVRDGRPGDLELGTLISDAPLPEATQAGSWWIDTRLDLMSAHLTRNDKGYSASNPLGLGGWEGPYLPTVVKEDAWGHAYLVNVLYLDPRNIVQELDGTMLGAVFVLSAGRNGIVETPYYQPRDAAELYGDDIGFRLQ